MSDLKDGTQDINDIHIFRCRVYRSRYSYYVVSVYGLTKIKEIWSLRCLA